VRRLASVNGGWVGRWLAVGRWEWVPANVNGGWVGRWLAWSGGEGAQPASPTEIAAACPLVHGRGVQKVANHDT
jgi:hypothetical protein